MTENPYPRLARNPPLGKRILARLLGRTKYFVDAVHFKAPTTIYLCYCGRHKVYFEDYAHGYIEYVVCPLCWEEEHFMDEEVDEDLVREILWDDYDDDDDEGEFDEEEDEMW